MLRDFVTKIQELAEPVSFTIDDREYSSKPLHEVKEPTPTPITLGTLQGLADYLAQNKDNLDMALISVHVKNPTTAVLFGPLSNMFCQRSEFVEIKWNVPEFLFDRYLSIEEFIIGLKSRLVPNSDLEKLIKLVGNIQESSVKQVTDDGFSQSVVTRTGITRIDEVVTPNPWMLKPYRTFVEVDQVESPFVLRFQKGHDEDSLPACALFETDGGMWRINAVQNICDWLKKNIPSQVAIIS